MAMVRVQLGLSNDSKSLHAHVEQLCAAIEQDNSMLRAARAQSLPRERLALFLYNTQQLIAHTPGFIDRATRLARTRGLDFFLPYLAAAAREEVGHHEWAEQDRRTLDAASGSPEGPLAVLPSMTVLIEWIGTTIDRDPLLLLPYVLFVEYLTVRVGPTFVNAIATSGVPREALTVISNHVVLDRDHVLNDFNMADQISTTMPDYAEPFRDTASQAAALYGAFLTEIAGGGQS